MNPLKPSRLGLLFCMILFLQCNNELPTLPKSTILADHIKYVHYSNVIQGLDWSKGEETPSKVSYKINTKDLLEDMIMDYGEAIIVYGPPVVEDEDEDNKPDCDTDEVEEEESSGSDECVVYMEEITTFGQAAGQSYDVVFKNKAGENIGEVDFTKPTQYQDNVLGYPITWKGGEKPSGTIILTMTEEDDGGKSTYNGSIRLR